MPVDPTLVDLAATLVRVDSTNPDLGTGGVGEAAVAGVVADWLREAGLEVTVEEIAPGRPNVIGVARGSGGGRSLLLNAHLDTVGAGGMAAPFVPVVRDGRLHGRGAADMKGSLAAVMLAAATAAGDDLRGDVIVAAVVDEEVGSLGTEALVRSWTAHAAIVAEPTDEIVAVAHKGFVQFEVETAGVAAHGSRPDLGVDAIAAMGPVLTGIARLAERLGAGPAHALLGSGSVHASLIEGGQEYSSYPARCLLVGERRTIPGETPEQVREEVEALAGGAAVRVPFHREPFETASDADVVVCLLEHLGREPTDVGGVPFWADSALLGGAGIPTVVFGPLGHGLHGDDEWVDLESLQRCHDAYLAVARAICA